MAFRDHRSESSTGPGAWRKLLTWGGLVLVVASGAATALAGPLYQQGVWGLGGAFSVFQWAIPAGFAGLLIALIAVVANARGSGLGHASTLTSILAVVVAIGWLYLPLTHYVQARSVPPIHDITTDTADPPAFSAVLERRQDASNPPEYAGAETAAKQREAYPDLSALRLDTEPTETLALAREVGKDLGWEVVGFDPQAGRLEAVATTFWFGFKDDVVVRVREAEGGSVVDVRSKSRVGQSDLGKNAERIRRFLQALRSAS